MPARSTSLTIATRNNVPNAYGVIEADKRNYELNNDPNGLANQTAYLNQLTANDAQRTGPVIANNESGQQAQFQAQQADQARIGEGTFASALAAQANGTGYNPALAQLQQSTQQAQANQRSLAAGSSGYDAAAAQREAAFQGANLDQQGVQQGRILGAQQQAFGRDQFANFADALRGQDLSMRQAQQANAFRQAQLEDAQRARNDAMATFYLGEQDRLRRAQTSANMNYEQQDAANKGGVANQDFSRNAFNQDMGNRYAGAAMSLGGTMLAAGSTYQQSQNQQGQQQQKKRDPEDPYADYG